MSSESAPAERPLSGPSAPSANHAHRGREDWRVIVAIFWLTSMIEGLGVSQVFAFLPSLLRDMGVAEADRLAFVGLFTALIFVVGAPLVPLWGVWADKYSRKAVIVRSCLVEAAVFACVALSREPWQLALSLLLIGFQLGNTGVMLAGIRDVVPDRRLGTTMALFGAAGPIGFAVGPILAGPILVDGLGWSFAAVFWLSAVLSLGTALLVAAGSREVRPTVVPEGRILDLAYGAVRGVVTDRAILRIFTIYFVTYLANQLSRPYQPVIVEGVVGTGEGLATAIGVVIGVAALIGALAATVGGALGDRLGFRSVLIGALVGGGIALLATPLAPTLALLALTVLAFTACNGSVGAMVFSLLSTEVPPERRSATLNLVYLPLYAAGIIGPIVGGIVAPRTGPGGPFVLGGLVFLVAAAIVAVRTRRSQVAPA
ncbi:MAG TPA: MFS transporter [Candidatus Limnocylindrales bacterium]|nr:MFS transporter [Candidatus Limnocylindrales bacterium]